VGFIAADILAERNGIKVNKLKFKALIGEGSIHSLKVLIVKPQTYMNLSGESVVAVMNYYKAEASMLTIIYDDIDIDMGRIRIRKQGSAGTHNGMRSVIYHLNYDNFSRIRIGIGKETGGDLKEHVISGFKKDEVPVMEQAILRAAEAMECLLDEGTDIAMSRYNSAVLQEALENDQ
jgi:PTH1 family peptidyl-tRNA hydrolase